MNTQFFIAVMSSLTTAAILAILRVVVKARKSVAKLANEHEFLMRSMEIVLTHLSIERPPIRHKR